jgi:hypothetical protein
MKLSTEPKHFAPRMKVRDLSGKLHTRMCAMNSNRPGHRLTGVYRPPTVQENMLQGTPAAIAKFEGTTKREVSLLRRIMSLFKRGNK